MDLVPNAPSLLPHQFPIQEGNHSYDTGSLVVAVFFLMRQHFLSLFLLAQEDVVI